jgi:hypothetical protein
MKKSIGTIAIVVTMTIVLYYLTIGMAVDSIDDFIEIDVTEGTIPDISIVNYILAIYTLVIAGSMLVSARFLSGDIKIALLAVIAGLCMTLLIAIIGLMGYPGMQMSPDRWGIILALYCVFVLQNPAMFLVIETFCMLAVYAMLIIKSEMIKQ